MTPCTGIGLPACGRHRTGRSPSHNVAFDLKQPPSSLCQKCMTLRRGLDMPSAGECAMGRIPPGQSRYPRLEAVLEISYGALPGRTCESDR